MLNKLFKSCQYFWGRLLYYGGCKICNCGAYEGEPYGYCKCGDSWDNHW